MYRQKENIMKLKIKLNEKTKAAVWAALWAMDMYSRRSPGCMANEMILVDQGIHQMLDELTLRRDEDNNEWDWTAGLRPAVPPPDIFGWTSLSGLSHLKVEGNTFHFSGSRAGIWSLLQHEGVTALKGARVVSMETTQPWRRWYESVESALERLLSAVGITLEEAKSLTPGQLYRRGITSPSLQNIISQS
jgi:hypothetical protein